jgi:hypothetical protein
MVQYVCIILHKSKRLERRELEADDLPQAIDKTIGFCLDHPTCTAYEIWQNKTKVHVAERVKMT